MATLRYEASPLPSSQPVQELVRPLWHRTVMFGSGALAVAGALDGILQYQRYITDSKLVGVNPVNTPDNTNPRLFLIGGYTQRSPFDYAELTPAMVGDFFPQYSTYSIDQDPLTPSAKLIAQDLAAHLGQYPTVEINAICMSMGGKFFIQAMAELVIRREQSLQAGLTTAPIPHIASLALHSSPFAMSDICGRQASFMRFFNRVHPATAYILANVVKSSIQIANELENNHRRAPEKQIPISECIKIGRKLAMQGGLARFCISQAQEYAKRPTQENIDILLTHGVIDDRTIIYFMRTKSDKDDHIVKLDASETNWRQSLEAKVAKIITLYGGDKHLSGELYPILSNYM